MKEVTYDQAEISRTAKRTKQQKERERVDQLQKNLQPIPKEFTYPRSEVHELDDGMYEFIYIDPNTTISRRVESTRNAKQSRNQSQSGDGGNGVSGS